MAVDLKEMPNLFCPFGCRFYSPQVDVTALYADFKAIETVAQLRCEHEDICKMWVEMAAKISTCAPEVQSIKNLPYNERKCYNET